jgi:hypothetical protein
MNSDDFKDRTKKFALRIIKLVRSLPDNIAGRTIGGQIFRSGTSLPPIIGLLAGPVQKLNLFLN